MSKGAADTKGESSVMDRQAGGPVLSKLPTTVAELAAISVDARLAARIAQVTPPEK